MHPIRIRPVAIPIKETLCFSPYNPSQKKEVQTWHFRLFRFRTQHAILNELINCNPKIQYIQRSKSAREKQKCPWPEGEREHIELPGSLWPADPRCVSLRVFRSLFTINQQLGNNSRCGSRWLWGRVEVGTKRGFSLVEFVPGFSVMILGVYRPTFLQMVCVVWLLHWTGCAARYWPLSHELNRVNQYCKG